jgi:hypothetical protein
MLPLLAVLSGRASASDTSLIIPVTPGSEPIVAFRRELRLQEGSRNSCCNVTLFPAVSPPPPRSLSPSFLSPRRRQISVVTSRGFVSYMLQLHILEVRL